MDAIYSGLREAVQMILTLDKEILSIVGLSVFVSSMSTAIGALIGVPCGILLGGGKFKLRGAVVRIIYTLMSTPPVIMGLVVFLVIMRRGPLGHLGLVFTPAAMIIAQTCLITPIVAGITYNQVKERAVVIKELAKTLGANRLQTLLLFLAEMRVGLLTAVITGFGRGIAEVGAVMIVGGNIKGYTRVMTTYISQLQGMGNYSAAIAVGLILLFISFTVNSALHYFQYEKGA